MALDSTKNNLQPGFIRLPEILSLIPISKSTWWAGVKSGRYPRGVKLSANTTAWRTDDIQTLLDELSGQSSSDS